MDFLDFTHGGNIYEARRRLKRKVLLDFSANINPFGIPRGVRKRIRNSINSILHYPDPGAKEMTEKIASYWGINEDNILVGNGSIELIYLVISAFKPKRVSIVIPTFSEYERAARAADCRIDFLKLNEKEDFVFDPSRVNPVRKKISNGVKRSDLLFLCNPNNPTGNITLNDRAIVEGLPNRLIVIDEAFMDFLHNEDAYTMIRKAPTSKSIVVLRTLTKFFALPGLRAGYLVADKDMICLLKRCQPPWNVNVLAQKAAEGLFDDKAYMDTTRKLIEKERAFLFNEISRIDCLAPYRSVTNFLLVRIEKKGLSAPRLAARLLKKGVLIRDCSNFRGLGNGFVRIAVRSREENLEMLAALRSAV